MAGHNALPPTKPISSGRWQIKYGMNPYPEEISRILDRLKANPRGMSVSDLSRDLGVNRNTVSRYLDMLLIAGEVEMRTYGKAKVFYLSQRVPLSAVINLSADGVFVLNDRLTVVQVNDRVLEVVQASRDEVVGKPLGESRLSAFDHPLIRGRIEAALEGQDVVEEVRLLKADGELFFRMKILSTVFNDGSPGITILLEDITEQKRSEEALREGEAKFRALVEDINDIIWNIDEAWAFVYVSPKSFDLLGYAPEEIEGHHIMDFVPPAEHEKVQHRLEEAIGSEKPFSLVSIPMTHRNGNRIVFEASGTPNFDEIGSFAGYRMVARDVTGRQQAERRVRGWKSFLHSIVQNIPDMVFVKEVGSGTYVFFNRAAEAFAGGCSEDLAGKRDEEIFPPDLVPFMCCGEDEVRRQMAPYDCPETAVTLREGEKHYLQAKKIPITGEDGGLKYILSIICDITTHVRADLLLREQRDLALALGSATGLGEALSLCLQTSLRVSGMEAGAVFSVDETTGDIVLVSASGLSEKFSAVMARIPAGPTVRRLLEGGVLSCPGAVLAAADPALSPFADEALAVVATRSILYPDRPVALLIVASRRQAAVPAYATHALETVGAQVSNVIGRIRARERVRMERDRAERYLDVAGVMIAVIGTDGTIERMNRMGCRILGYREADLVDRNWFATLVPASLREKYEGNFRRLMEGTVVPPEEETTPVVTRDGREVAVLWHNAIVRDENGCITGLVSSGSVTGP
ncbi:PAS domain S-box protein [Methanofollis formosanus]|uniref:PAS domain S-box protein n=1 Tax=Methanofollis formosanus TaxID=299308 RepID=A0A8G1EG32_9EURY|nr:PAS domain S-box protein [Methanofollis formosanus]QYZ79408.1 PAS domain S-box protein [Methanofollis formosanus]